MTTPPRIALATLAAALSPLVFAHATVVSSFPAKGEELAGAPNEIHLTFSERVDPRGCRIKLVSSAGKNFDADRPHADKVSPTTLVAAVPVLRPGNYRARWVCTGGDGKKLRGDFTFSVK